MYIKTGEYENVTDIKLYDVRNTLISIESDEPLRKAIVYALNANGTRKTLFTCYTTTSTSSNKTLSIVSAKISGDGFGIVSLLVRSSSATSSSNTRTETVYDCDNVIGLEVVTEDAATIVRRDWRGNFYAR